MGHHSSKKILVTGADGFTGKYVTELAKEYGYAIFALDSNLNDLEALRCEISRVRPTHVIHLAGISSVMHHNEFDFYKVNVFGTINLLDCLSKYVPCLERVIVASSANVYGNVGDILISESTPVMPTNHYANSKASMEFMAHNFFETLPLIIVRPFNYTGVGQDLSFVIPKIVSHFAARAQSINLGNINVHREYNDIRMVADSYIKLLECDASRMVVNLCSGISYSLSNVLDELRSLTGHDVSVNIDPRFVRNNEVYRLAGSPKKLLELTKEVKWFGLQDTLSWMLENAYREKKENCN